MEEVVTINKAFKAFARTFLIIHYSSLPQVRDHTWSCHLTRSSHGTPVVQTQIQEKKLVEMRAMDYAYYLLLLHYDVFLGAGVTLEKSREAYLAAYKSSIEGRENRKSEEKQDAIARLLLSDLEHKT